MPTAVGATTPTSLSNFVPYYWDAVFGENLYPNLFYYQLGAKRKVPRNFGLTIRIPRLIRKTGNVAVVASTNFGTLAAISARALSGQWVSGQLQKFVGVYANSDIILLTAIGDATELALRDLARDLALQMDSRCRNVLSSKGYYFDSTNVKGASSGSVATASTLRASTVMRAVATLDAFNNPRPPDGNYPLVLHPMVAYDLAAALSGSNQWVNINQYATDATVEKLYRGELGRIYGARIITSTNVLPLIGAKGMSAKASGFQNLMIAPEAYYVCESDDMTARTVVKPLGSGGTYDPDNSLSTVAAKVFFECVPGFQNTGTPAEYRYIRLLTGATRL